MLCFSNPGELDPRLISLFGASLKPNSPNPVGKFGTGLKHALAVLLREGCEVSIQSGESTYTFNVATDTIRGQSVEMVEMLTDGPEGSSLTLLPFTLSLGLGWAPWMAYRELYYNALDEGGAVDCWPGGVIPHSGPDWTNVIVYGLDEVHAQREDFLLLSAPLWANKDFEIHPGSGHSIFMRGVRVCELEKPTVLRYNILRQMDLTEDRTLALPYMVPHHLKYWVAGALDDPQLLAQILSAAKGTFEHDQLDFMRLEPSPAFLLAAQATAPGGSPSARALAKYLASPPAPIRPSDLNPVVQAMLDDCIALCRRLDIPVDSLPMYYVEDAKNRAVETKSIVLRPDDFDSGDAHLAQVLIKAYMDATVDYFKHDSWPITQLVRVGQALGRELV